MIAEVIPLLNGPNRIQPWDAKTRMLTGTHDDPQVEKTSPWSMGVLLPSKRKVDHTEVSKHYVSRRTQRFDAIQDPSLETFESREANKTRRRRRVK